MRHNKKKTYVKEIEAAWYALNGFISTFDHVVSYIDKYNQKQIVTPNPNCVLASCISKNGLLKPKAITKSMFPDHFNRDVIIFYKSSPNSRLTTGYGKYDKEATALPFSAELEIITKRTTDPKNHVMLLGIDIDCHNGEWHVHEVEELIKKYLPNTYWEDSTNGKGRHGYLKIKFIKSFGILDKISKFLEKLFAKLNELKKLHGYEAPIDDPAGLPYKMEFTDNNFYIENWTTLFHKSGKEYKFLGKHINPKSKIWKNYISYLINNTFHYIPEKCYSFPSKLSLHISKEDIQSTFSKFLSDNNISFPPPTKNKKYYKIIYQRAFKLPMFGATASDYDDAVPDINGIKQFHFLPYYIFSDLHGVYHQILEDIQVLKLTPSAYLHYHRGYHLSSGSLYINPYVGISSSSSDSSVDIFSIPIPIKGENSGTTNQIIQKNMNTETVNIPALKKKEENIGNNCACTNTQNRSKNRDVGIPEDVEVKPDYPDFIDWSGFVEIDQEDFKIDRFWNNYKQSKSSSNSSTYMEKLELAKAENNTMKRTSWFICIYINKLGRIPTVDEAEREYVGRGLNRNRESSTLNRRKRFSGCIDYYSKEYDESQSGFKLDWSDEKIEILNFINSHIPENLSYRQGKRIKSISPEDIGFVYHVICRMDDSEQYVILGNSLSYSQADELFLAEFGKKCGRHKFSAIIKNLLSCDLIEKVRNYKVGLRGNCYVAKRNMGNTG